MDDSPFDRMVRRLARHQLSRRAVLGATGLGLAATMARGTESAAQEADAGGTPAVQSTPFACPADTTTALNVDGAWLCDQPYALCTSAPCEPSESDPKVANCRCVVVNGFSIGFTTCAERTPTETAITSTFSTQNVTRAFGIMTCPESVPWANCLDMPCEIDVLNPAQATCRCPIVESGPSFTFGGGCDTSSCSAVLWSAAEPPGVTQYATAMQCVNQSVTFPAVCPGATPATG